MGTDSMTHLVQHRRSPRSLESPADVCGGAGPRPPPRQFGLHALPFRLFFAPPPLHRGQRTCLAVLETHPPLAPRVQRLQVRSRRTAASSLPDVARPRLPAASHNNSRPRARRMHTTHMPARPHDRTRPPAHGRPQTHTTPDTATQPPGAAPGTETETTFFSSGIPTRSSPPRSTCLNSCRITRMSHWIPTLESPSANSCQFGRRRWRSERASSGHTAVERAGTP